MVNQSAVFVDTFCWIKSGGGGGGVGGTPEKVGSLKPTALKLVELGEVYLVYLVRDRIL